MAALCAAPSVRAADFCVDTVQELVAAVDAFSDQADGTTLTIKVVQGSYVVGNQLNFVRSTYPRAVGFKLLGGYTANCASRTINPQNTTIDGNNQVDSGINISTYFEANIYIEGITFTRLVGAGPHNRAFDLGNDNPGGDTAYFAIRHCRITRSSAAQVLYVEAPQMRLINSQISDNTVAAGGAAVYIKYALQADSSLALNNSTITNNSGVGVQIFADNDGHQSDRVSEVADNILWANAGGDLNLTEFNTAANSLLLHGNIIGSSAGTLPAGQNNNLASNPRFINAGAANYGLVATSPAINSGSAYQRYDFPSIDLAGDTRVIGTSIDRGAYESSIDDRTQFVVTNVGDNGNNTSPLAGSLRAAIKAANFASQPFNISFAISGACPRLINISTPMLDVTGDVTIDGRTQSGWQPNSTFGAFSGTNCVILSGSGNVPYALRVPSGASAARLAVHGFMFAGFTDAAIRLEDGSNHRIAGNQFGAVPFTASNHDAIRVTANADTTFIGGYDDPSAVNLIAGSSNTGIYLDNTTGGTVVANNVIGFQPDGISALGNPIGVYIFNSPANTLQYNYIGYNTTAGVTLSGAGTSATSMQYNIVGLDRTAGPAGNIAAGVIINFAAQNNTIGADLSSRYGGNTLARNQGPGVWISASGGSGNRILGNSIHSNVNVEIDLGSAGASANQASNPVAGPNHLQNYPILAAATRNSATSTSLFVSGTLHSAPSSTYRIDVYAAPDCDSIVGRGNAQLYLGYTFVQTNSIGDASYSKGFTAPADAMFDTATATVTSSGGDTSEIGSCVDITIGAVPQLIYKDGFE